MARIVNQERPQDGTERFIPPQQPIEVEARIVHDDGTEEWVPATALKWTRPTALVNLHDGRRRHAWLPARDIRRTDETGPADADPVP